MQKTFHIVTFSLCTNEQHYRLVQSQEKSSYFLEAIWDGLISFPRIRFGGGPGGGPGGSVRPLFTPVFEAGLKTPASFFGIRIFRFFAGFGFGFISGFGLRLIFRCFLGSSNSSSSKHSSSSSSESESWSLKCLRSGNLCFSHRFNGRTFCMSKSFLPYKWDFKQNEGNNNYRLGNEVCYLLIRHTPKQNRTLGAASKFHEGGVQEDIVDLLISNELSADAFLSS